MFWDIDSAKVERLISKGKLMIGSIFNTSQELFSKVFFTNKNCV